MRGLEHTSTHASLACFGVAMKKSNVKSSVVTSCWMLQICHNLKTPLFTVTRHFILVCACVGHRGAQARASAREQPIECGMSEQ